MPVWIENVRHWITLDNFQKSSLLSRSVLLEVKKLGLLSTSRSPAAFHEGRTEGDRVGLEMVWETTEESFFQNIRSGDKPSYAVGDALWQLERTPSKSDFLKFAQVEWSQWTRTYRDNASPRAALFTRVTASSHGRLSFRPVLVTTAHAQSSLPSPFSVGMKLLFTP